MFSIFENRKIISYILEICEKELLYALEFRQKQFGNDQLYIKVFSDEKIKFILEDEHAIIITQDLNQLFEDQQIKEQLKKIPAFILNWIDLESIKGKVERKLKEILKKDDFLLLKKVDKDLEISLFHKNRKKFAALFR
jgi:hypothetical protein